MRKLKKTAISSVVAACIVLTGNTGTLCSLANEIHEMKSGFELEVEKSSDDVIASVTDAEIMQIDSTASVTDAEEIIEDEAALIQAAKAETEEVISYSVHQQSYGDVATCHNGDVAGNINTGKRLEAFVINRDSASSSELEGNIQYRAHCQSHGWMDWKTDGEVAGTTGQSKRLEAIQIQLTGELAEAYDIYYKVYMSNCGWLDWTKNGEIAGTVGYASVIEGVQVLLVKKDSEYAPVTGRYASITSENMNDIIYSGHAQTYGNLTAVSNGASLGTTGQSKRLEAMTIKVSHGANEIYGTVKYKVHCQSYGWMDEVSESNLAGTTGKSKRLEAVSINLSGDLAKYCNVYYRVHCQKFGWMGWAKNGENAGTSGNGYRMEAIQIIILPKGTAAPGSTKRAYTAKSYEESVEGYEMLAPYLDRIIGECTNSSMTQQQKLRALYDYVRTHYTYRTLSNDCPNNFIWHQYYAYQIVTTGSGNCYGFNYLLGHLAMRIGYTDVKFFKGYVCPARYPHGWVEINGLIYDPELHYKNGIEFFGVKNYEVWDYHYN